ncbi:MAG: hypothetical protein IT379_09815 [Deltaproteobacteria bacterium]|nr:hypothetical protein [Deltaproteobacteria bacterium]
MRSLGVLRGCVAVLVVVASVLVAAGCSCGDVVSRCAPGRPVACRCASGADGEATCSPLGTPGPCACTGATPAAGDMGPLTPDLGPHVPENRDDGASPSPPGSDASIDAPRSDPEPRDEAGPPTDPDAGTTMRPDAGTTMRPDGGTTTRPGGGTTTRDATTPDASGLPSWDGGVIAAPPYVLLIADTSGSMAAETGRGTNRCGYDQTRANDLKCALRTVLATGVPAVLGLARFHVDSCETTSRPTGCTTASYSPSGGRSHGEYGSCLTPCVLGAACDDRCWPDLTADPADPADTRARTHDAADVVVPIGPDSAARIATWTDATCSFPDDPELDVHNWTPLAGSLGTALRYFAGRLSATDPALESPIRSDPSRACRRYAVVLLTDGLETCGGEPAARAADLLATTVDGVPQPVRTHVIGVGVGADIDERMELDAIAAAGDGGEPTFAATEDDIIRALFDIVAREAIASCPGS